MRKIERTGTKYGEILKGKKSNISKKYWKKFRHIAILIEYVDKFTIYRNIRKKYREIL